MFHVDGPEQNETVRTVIGSQSLKAVKTVKQFVEVCEDVEKPRKLQRIMERIVDKEVLNPDFVL